jgi:hypothetical protein
MAVPLSSVNSRKSHRFILQGLKGRNNSPIILTLPFGYKHNCGEIAIQPGVTEEKNIGDSATGGGGGFGTTFRVNGARGRANNFTLDRAVRQNQFARNPSSEGDTVLGAQGIKEYRVITTNFQAEYGVIMGRQAVMVSANGTNQNHGHADLCV